MNSAAFTNPTVHRRPQKTRPRLCLNTVHFNIIYAPDRPWGPPSLLYNGYQVSFQGVKRPGQGVNHPPPSNTEIKERVELHHYSPLCLRGMVENILHSFLFLQTMSTFTFHLHLGLLTKPLFLSFRPKIPDAGPFLPNITLSILQLS
jgi:hypothetical protein